MTVSISNQIVDYESMIAKTYGTGLYQILLTFFCSMTSFMYALDLQSMIFMHYQPPFICSDSRLEQFRDVIWLPHDPKQVPASSSSELIKTNIPTKQCWALVRNQTSPIYTEFACTKWTFDNTTMLNTIVSQFHLVCDSEFWIPMSESFVLFFNAIGFLLSSSTDLIGRKIPFFSLCGLEIVTNVIMPFAWSPITLLILRCLHGITAGAGYIGIILITELVPQDKRALYGTVYWLNFSLGYMACAGLAYWLRDWYKLRLWFCVFHLFYLTYPYFVCDTPRWLGLKNKIEPVIRLLKRLTKWNRVHLDPDYMKQVKTFLADDSSKYELEDLLGTTTATHDKFVDIFRNSELRKRTIALGFVHTGLALVYFGLVTDNQFASTNIFLNVFLLGLVEVPANFAGWKAADIFGRSISLSILLGLSCVAVIGAGGFKTVHWIIQCGFATFGKFVLTVSYCVADLYIVELFPTTLRTRAMFLIVTIAGFASALSPYINQLQSEWEYLPCLIYSTLCIFSAILVYLYLPETKDQPLTQTVEQCSQLKKR